MFLSRFLKFPGGEPLSSYPAYSDTVEIGVERGEYGAFRWVADFPVGSRFALP